MLHQKVVNRDELMKKNYEMIKKVAVNQDKKSSKPKYKEINAGSSLEKNRFATTTHDASASHLDPGIFDPSCILLDTEWNPFQQFMQFGKIHFFFFF